MGRRTTLEATAINESMPNVTASRTLLSPGRLGTHRWVWPLPVMDGVPPSICGPVESTDDMSVQLGYQGHGAPKGFVPILAVHDGVVTYAVGSKDRAMLCLDHPGGWSTRYESFEYLTVLQTDRFRRRRCTRVQTGDVLGYVRRDPVLIRFSISQLTDRGLQPVAPDDRMRTWTLLDWSDSTPRARRRVAA